MSRRAAAVLLAGLTLLGTAAPAVAAGSSGSSRSSGSSGSSSGGRVEEEPSAQEVQAQQARVARLRQQVETQAADQADARRQLDATATLAGQALEASASAVRALQVAELAEQRSADELEVAEQRVAGQRRQLGEWARAAYRNGGQFTSNVTMTVLLSANNNDDVTTGLNVIKRLGEQHSANLDTLVVAQAASDRAADRAAAAAQAAAQGAVGATNARRAADTAVAQQRQLLGRADSALGLSRVQLSGAERHQRDLEAAAQQAEAARLAAARNEAGNAAGNAKNNAVTGAVGDCTGGENIAQYGNGMIPVAALCPLQADPRHHLRADAAYAFDRLSSAYVQQFGEEPCITDSYRSYAEQVDVYARKPGLAARPGTSNHGWGTALDLCGGIQDFTSSSHRWMKLNAPLYGWFHPAWAEPGGSKPEPWHWEFSG